jgi:hypothetical protein
VVEGTVEGLVAEQLVDEAAEDVLVVVAKG